jgi:hypothetical protein
MVCVITSRSRFHLNLTERLCSGGRARFSAVSIAAGLLFFAGAGGIAHAQALTWAQAGPRPSKDGQVEGIQDGEVVGAVKAIAPHPSDPNTVYAGAVNGGVWKTTNALAAHPHWSVLTDGLGAASIGALAFDPTDASAATLVAGIGWFSSLGFGGARAGMLRTTNGGTSWTAIDGNGVLRGLNVSGVAARGNILLLAANNADNPDTAFQRSGLWRATDPAGSWTQVSGGANSALPQGPCFDLAADPVNSSRLYTNGGYTGIYRSDDAGATWTKVSSAPMDALLANCDNARIAVGKHDDIYVAIVVDQPADGQSHFTLGGIFRSGDAGGHWTALDNPRNADSDLYPGGQGNIHMALAADPEDPNIVYIGGDRQALTYNTATQKLNPNSIGATDFSGLLFRGNASRPAGAQWVHITHAPTVAAPEGGTASRTAPHADSRALVFSPASPPIRQLFFGCDGGIYRRVRPESNAGDWFSANGDLEVTEFHAVAYDSNAHTVIGGAQDTGSPEQPHRDDDAWESVSTGDGGVVAVDDKTTPGRSVRYSSYDNFGQFRRREFNAANVLLSDVNVPLNQPQSAPPFNPQFYTPIKLNTVDPRRLVIGATSGVYESLNRGDSISIVRADAVVNGSGPNPIAYGAAGNADVLYVGADTRVLVRRQAAPAQLADSNYQGGFVVGVAIDPNDPKTAQAASASTVSRTTDFGDHWTDITGNLATLAPGDLRTLAYGTYTSEGAILVGADTGVFEARGPNFNTWTRLGAGLPRVPVFHLEHSATDNLILAGTFGRGAWILKLPGAAPPAGGPPP